MSKIVAIVGRLLLSVIFIVSGISKLADVASTQTMLAEAGLAPSLAVPVGIFELGAGILLAAGFMTRLVAVLLFLFVAATILFFHNQFTDPAQAMAALKNLAVMGGLLLAFAHSHMWWHYDSMRRERRGELAARDAETRAHDAELRAARAEATAEATRDTHHHTPVTDVDRDGVSDVRGRRRWFDW